MDTTEWLSTYACTLFHTDSLLSSKYFSIPEFLPSFSPVLILCNYNAMLIKAPKLWPPDTNNWLIRKDPDAGKDWRQEEKGMKEDEMIGWHHQLDWHEFEQALGVGDRQGSLVYCNPWGNTESDMTEQLNWTD